MKTARRSSSASRSSWRGRRNIKIVGESPVQNTWVYLEGDLINDETGVVQSFPIDISYYQGVEDGESWSEGGQSDSAYTSSMPAGRYVLRVGGAVGDAGSNRRTVSIRIEQNVTRGFNLLIALIVLSIGPVSWSFITSGSSDGAGRRVCLVVVMIVMTMSKISRQDAKCKEGAKRKILLCGSRFYLCAFA
jgi:hypothetical protein